MRINTYHINTQHVQEYLKRKGITPIQYNSWKKNTINKYGLKKLILTGTNQLDIIDTTKVNSQTVHCALPANESNKNALTEYFNNFFTWIIHDLKKNQINNFNKVIIVVNFMPFSFTKSVVHKIFSGLKQVVSCNKEFNNPSLQFTFLVQNSESFLGCWMYQELVKTEEYKAKMLLIDYRGFSCVGMSKTKYHLKRSLFADALKLDENAFYKKLIFETNNFIGHFKLDGAHVRTHYDLTDFARNNYVVERILSKIQDLIGEDYEHVWVVYAGIELDALLGICSRIQRYINRQTWDILSPDQFSRQLSHSEPECVLLLADIVCSGSTLESLANELKHIKSIPVIPLTIIRMQNSPEHIGDATLHNILEVKRDYYPANEDDCKLCRINQPSIRVQDIDDFKVIKSFLTPYDFWEIVHDCNALKIREEEASGRKLEVRVETKTIFSRYKHWLHNLILAQYNENLDRYKPNLILTVKEEGGELFSQLICEALSLNVNSITPVEKDVLNVSSTQVDRNEQSLFSGKRVLLVDDGINNGGTMKMLIDYCANRGARPIGAFVFDSRINGTQLQNLKTSMARGPIMSLYRWPGTAIHFKKQDATN